LVHPEATHLTVKKNPKDKIEKKKDEIDIKNILVQLLASLMFKIKPFGSCPNITQLNWPVQR
jgi:hypothetical protein